MYLSSLVDKLVCKLRNNNNFFLLELQLFAIRFYIGIDFIHHFAEKFGILGHTELTNVTNYFASIGYSSQMVLMAGVFELVGCISFTLGLFTRLNAVVMCIYLIVALFAGNHHHMGFIWANKGGGWEFPLFWAFMCLSFILSGGGPWSIDCIIKSKLPQKLKFLSI